MLSTWRTCKFGTNSSSVVRAAVQPSNARIPPGPSLSLPRFRPRRGETRATVNVTPSRCRSDRSRMPRDPSDRSTAISRMRATSPSDGVSCGRVGLARDDRVQPESADRDIERRQRAEDAHRRQWQRDFFVRLPQRRLLERLAGIDHAARQRHLPAMTQRVGAHGEDDVRFRHDRQRCPEITAEFAEIANYPSQRSLRSPRFFLVASETPAGGRPRYGRAPG